MAVENPWIDVSPVPSTCQVLGGDPGLAFSPATGFAHAAQPPAGCTAVATIAAASATTSRRHPGRAGTPDRSWSLIEPVLIRARGPGRAPIFSSPERSVFRRRSRLAAG